MGLTPPPAADRTRIWLRRMAIAAGLLLVLLVGLVAFVAYQLSKPIEKAVGGNWIVSEPPHLLIESGYHPRSLQRVHGSRRVTVANNSGYPVYIGDDCVLFSPLLEQPSSIKAACGDRQPITLGYWDNRGWFGTDPVRLDGKELSWAEIRRQARLAGSLGPP